MTAAWVLGGQDLPEAACELAPGFCQSYSNPTESSHRIAEFTFWLCCIFRGATAMVTQNAAVKKCFWADIGYWHGRITASEWASEYKRASEWMGERVSKRWMSEWMTELVTGWRRFHWGWSLLGFLHCKDVHPTLLRDFRFLLVAWHWGIPEKKHAQQPMNLNWKSSWLLDVVGSNILCRFERPGGESVLECHFKIV